MLAKQRISRKTKDKTVLQQDRCSNKTDREEQNPDCESRLEKTPKSTKRGDTSVKSTGLMLHKVWYSYKYRNNEDVMHVIL